MKPRITLKEFALHAAILFGLLIALFPMTFLNGEVPLPGDILFRIPPWSAYAPEDYDRVLNKTTLEALTQFASWSRAMQYALEEGEFPLWNPFQFAGMPLLANFQSAVVYPPRVVFGFLDLLTATTVVTLFKMWLCGATAYVCGRGIGLSVNASRFLSVCWMLGGYNVLWCYWQETDVAAWIPIVFLGTEWLVDGRFRKGLFCSAFGATLILLAGHPETAFTFSLGVGIYFFLRLAASRRALREWFKAVGGAAAAWGATLLISMVVILPFFEYLDNSFTLGARAEGEAMTHFFEPSSVVAFWVPRFFGSTGEGNYWAKENSNFMSTLYPGMVMWIAVFSLFVSWGQSAKTRLRVCSLIPGMLVSLALAYDLPPLKPINDLPVIRSMWGMHHAAFAVFAVPLVGAMAFDQWFRKPVHERKVWRIGAPVGLLAILLAAVFIYHYNEIAERALTSYTLAQIAFTGLFAAASVAVLYGASKSAQPKRWAVLLIVLLGVDLLVANRNLLPTTPRDRTLIDTKLTEFLQALPEPTRVSCQTATIPAGVMPIYGIRQLWSYEGIYPGRLMRFMSQRSRCPWERYEPLTAMHYYLFPAGALAREGDKNFPNFEYVATLDGIDVFRNTNAVPHAFLVQDYVTAPNPDDVFDVMCEDDLDFERAAVLETREKLAAPSGGHNGTATIVDVTSATMTVQVDAPSESFLVVSEAFYPGWHAYVDGAYAEIYPAYHAFRAVRVPEGAHEVQFRYEPASFRTGFNVSVATLIAGCAAALVVLFRWARKTVNGTVS